MPTPTRLPPRCLPAASSSGRGSGGAFKSPAANRNRPKRPAGTAAGRQKATKAPAGIKRQKAAPAKR
eukprot:978092-Prorocentrum_minimum.AAC.2